MRPASFFAILAVAVHSLPITPYNDSILGNLQDLLFKSLGGLFTYPYYNYGQATSCYSCNFQSKFCVSQCVSECVGGAEACSDCLSSCYRDNTSCFGGLRGNVKGNNDNGNQQSTPTNSDESTPDPTAPTTST